MTDRPGPRLRSRLRRAWADLPPRAKGLLDGVAADRETTGRP